MNDDELTKSYDNVQPAGDQSIRVVGGRVIGATVHCRPPAAGTDENQGQYPATSATRFDDLVTCQLREARWASGPVITAGIGA